MIGGRNASEEGVKERALEESGGAVKKIKGEGEIRARVGREEKRRGC